MGKFDPNAFNTDPKHQEQRDFLDALVAASALRLKEKAKKEKKTEPEGLDFFDFLKTGEE